MNAHQLSGDLGLDLYRGGRLDGANGPKFDRNSLFGSDGNADRGERWWTRRHGRFRRGARGEQSDNSTQNNQEIPGQKKTPVGIPSVPPRPIYYYSRLRSRRVRPNAVSFLRTK